eukprot:CAMPEP_0184292506 /NCGR_PEP_ID=MMETSP1049-20130417/4274_1 /TAXON_ID=77928 /ORGANISM="Proteomonas sulcata, Strain CCMP704" /LENGTH=123 /DNA_ID=CAMNT_0026600301 /DNA_START=167 /DNA_END=538 /DNA_ORIENTATION=-
MAFALGLLAVIAPSGQESIEMLQGTSPANTQELFYVPKPGGSVAPHDYFDLRQLCITACERARSANPIEDCGAEKLGNYWLKYRDDCAADYTHKCACNIKYIYCGGNYRVQQHPQYAVAGVCR